MEPEILHSSLHQTTLNGPKKPMSIIRSPWLSARPRDSTVVPEQTRSHPTSPGHEHMYPLGWDPLTSNPNLRIFAINPTERKPGPSILIPRPEAAPHPQDPNPKPPLPAKLFCNVFPEDKVGVGEWLYSLGQVDVR